MNPVTQVRVFFNCRDDVGMKITRKRSRELDARQTSRSHGAQESTERRRAREAFESVFDARPIAVHVLTDKMNFLIAQSLESLRFGDDLHCRTAAFAPA